MSITKTQITFSDLAGFHYSKQTVAWMDENVNVVPKYISPPNVPQARPIENFWGVFGTKSLRGRLGDQNGAAANSSH